MNRISPKLRSTETNTDLRKWSPTTFDNVLCEIDYLSLKCGGGDQIPLFRGHVQHDWCLECTIVRTILAATYCGNPPYPRPISFHTRMIDVILEKFTCRCKPSDEAFEKERTDGIDPEYEMMRYLQQHAEMDRPPVGTFLTDWTTERDIALYFSTYDGKGDARRVRNSSGALWVFFPMATGNVLMTKKVREIFDLMRGEEIRLHANRTLPIIFHPSKQTGLPRVKTQKSVYVAQMDFRYDLATAWVALEEERQCCVFKKIILSESVLHDAVRHLEKNGIDEKRVYPE